MSLSLTNSRDIVATKISLIQGNEVNDILDIIAAANTGGAVTSASPPLSITAGVLSIDLTSYATQSWVSGLLASYTLTSQLFAGVTVGTGIFAVAGNGTLALSLTGQESRTALKLADGNGVVRDLTSTTAGLLTWSGSEVALASSLAGKIDTLTASAPLTVSGSGTSRALALLWKPSTVTASTGLLAVANDATGTLSLGLTGLESRTALKLADGNGAVRDLTSTTAGVLTWDGSAVALSSDLANKIDSVSAAAPLVISGTGTSRALSTLFKPTTVTVATGLLAVANDAAGTLSLSLTGLESRAAMKLVDGNGVVRDLTSSTAGALSWNGSVVALSTDLAGKIDTLTAAAPLSISGTGTSRALSSLWKPSTVTAATGLLAVANDSAGTLGLSLTGLESRTALKLADAQGAVRDLASGAAGTLTWNGSAVAMASQLFTQLNAAAPLAISSAANPSGGTTATFDTLWKPSTVTVGTGLFALANDSAGTLALSLTGTESRAALKLSDPQGTVRDLTSTNAGELTWGGTALQPALAYISEGTANTSVVQYLYGPTNTPIWVNPYYTNNGNQSQSITYQVVLTLGGTTLNQEYILSIDLKTDNNVTPELLVSVGDTTTFNYGKIFNLTDSFQTIQLPWFGMATGAANIHLGYNAAPLGLTQPGGVGIQVQLRNFAVYEVGSSPSVAISQQLSVASDVRIGGSLVNTSDKRLKDDVQTLDPSSCIGILQGVEAKVYQRTDLENGQRVGFLADDVLEACLAESLYVSNLVNRVGAKQYLGLDYGRLTAILWQVCRSQEERLQALETSLAP